ncbi:hypothetical protein JXB28_05065 [Candidatus Woesearchaeota archaeon]|nr:hypothetical protein [Candidatus Woesearchaeota archaeon]
MNRLKPVGGTDPYASGGRLGMTEGGGDKFINFGFIRYSMEVKEIDLWWKFYIPIPYKPNETEEEFLKKAMDCLVSFYKKNTKTPKSEWDIDPFKGVTLESLKGDIESWSFRDLELEGIVECNVDFYVGTPQRNYGRIGIEVLTNANKPAERKPMIDFLRQKWKEFDYNF